jgi:glycosyltransferase involved in cell wall biosynthesis
MNASAQPQGHPVVSIVVPAHDAGAFIGRCLESIACQMGCGFELIVVDDGSRDDTAALVQAVQARHAELAMRMVRQQNQGIAGARNRGLREARGKYIAFVDADDMMLPGALAALGDVIAHHRPDVIACDFATWHPGKEHKNRHVALGHARAEILTDTDAILRTFFADRHMYVWAHVMRRDIYMRLPQPVFPLGRVFEDVSVLPSLVAQCRSLYRLACPTIAYRQHRSSLKQAVSPKWCLDFAAALRQVKAAFSARATGAPLQMQVDAAACHFYIGIFKNSYQLRWSAGRAAREQVRQMFLSSLFHDPVEVLAAMERGTILSRDRALDAAVARQVRKALDGRLLFALAKSVSRKIKLWQRVAA